MSNGHPSPNEGNKFKKTSRKKLHISNEFDSYFLKSKKVSNIIIESSLEIKKKQET